MNLKRKIKQFTTHLKFEKLNLQQERELGVIIFSKDRPIQLFALLESYSALCDDENRMAVIYKCSNEEYKKGYREIEQIWGNVDFIEELEFRDTLLSTINNMAINRVLFLVDDIIFTRNFSTSSFDGYDLKHTVPSLRLGKNIVYSYVRQKEIMQPEFIENDLHIEWKWIRRNSYWSYPLSLDGHIFDKTELLFMLGMLSFQAPNSLEESLSFFNKIFLKRKGVSYEKSVLVNIPWNLVQTEIQNLHENITTEDLLKYWNNNQKIDISRFANVENDSCHKNYELQLIPR